MNRENGLALKGYCPLLHTRGPETFTSQKVGSIMFTASDFFISGPSYKYSI